MELVLIRHPRVIIEEGICYGQSDLECCDQALRDMTSLVDDAFDLVVTSPLKRCTRVASEVLRSPFVTDRRLLELNFGEWELKSWNDIYQDKRSTFWFDNYYDSSPPGGESLIELHSRVGDLLRELDRAKKQKICLIAHAGSIRSVMLHLKKLPLTEFFSISIPLGSALRVVSE